MRVLLGLQPLTTTAYSLQVKPANNRQVAGRARSYSQKVDCHIEHCKNPVRLTTSVSAAHDQAPARHGQKRSCASDSCTIHTELLYSNVGAPT